MKPTVFPTQISDTATLNATLGTGVFTLKMNGFSERIGTTSLADINLNGFQFTINTGGGNAQTYNGAITGPGTLRFQGRSDATWTPDMRVGGTGANSPGNVVIDYGRVQLHKTPGVDALAGPIAINTSQTVRIQLLANDQINDASTIASASSSGAFHLMMGSFSDTIAGLTIKTGHTVEIEAGGVLTVTNLTVNGELMGPGTYTSSAGFVTGGGSVVVPGTTPPADAGLSTVSASPASVTANGSSTATVSFISASNVVDISNALYPWEPANPNAGVRIDGVVAADKTARLVGVTQTHWTSGGFSRPVDLNGNTLIIDSGGGNTCIASGPITGNGLLRVNAGGIGMIPIRGSMGNTYTGSTEINSGPVKLEKTSGNALNGTITVNGAMSNSFPNTGNLLWGGNNQVNDASNLILSEAASLNPAGYSDTVGTLAITGNANIYLGASTSVLRFADSSAAAWTSGKQLIIREWNGSPAGGGTEGVFFGTSASGLSAAQLAKVGFMNPAGFATGLYQAAILATGEVVPSGTAVVPVNPPYDLSPAATFEQALRDLAATAATQGVTLIFATSAARNESPVGAGPNDAAIDQFSAIMQTVASDTGSTFVDLRSAFVAWWQNNNYEIRLDGSYVVLKNFGFLTYDGVHPTSLGNQLIADHLADGILAALTAASPFETWAAANAGGQTASEDFDQDGIPNGVEYFMGETGSSFTPNPQVVTVSGVSTVTWPRDPAAVAAFKIQISDDLSEWTDILPPHASIDQSQADEITYTLPGGATRKFCRLAVTP